MAACYNEARFYIQGLGGGAGGRSGNGREGSE